MTVTPRALFALTALIVPTLPSVAHARTAGAGAWTGPEFLVRAAANSPSDIQFEHVWARATAGNATTGAAYLTVTGAGQPDRLTGASTPVAAAAELHETIDDKGVMKMRPVTAVPLIPGKAVTFKPGGYHIMLMGLKNPLKAGESFPLTLTFEHAGPVTVTVKVEATGGMGMGHDHGSMPGGMKMDHDQGPMTGHKP